MTDPLCAALGLDFGFLTDLVGLLRERGETVATAESLTAGLVAAALTSVPGSSAVVRGGLVVYATELKDTLAGVPAELLAAHGAVHPDVAAALAHGARTACGADWGLGLTGVAGPDPQDGMPPGTVYVGVAHSERAQSDRVMIESVELTGGRHEIRAGAVRAVLHGLHRALTIRFP